MVEAKGDGFHAFVGPALVLRGSHFGSTWARTTSSPSPGITVGRTVSAGRGPADRRPPWRSCPICSRWRSANATRARNGFPHGSCLRRPGPITCALSYGTVLASRPPSRRRWLGQGINLEAVLQEPGYPKDALPFVITVELCEEAALAAAMQEIAAADFHAEPPLALPMLLGDSPRT